jgi:hypothetical protein
LTSVLSHRVHLVSDLCAQKNEKLEEEEEEEEVKKRMIERK